MDVVIKEVPHLDTSKTLREEIIEHRLKNSFI